MNKKKIIIIAVSLVLAICAGVGCFHLFTYKYYSPEAKIVKQLLAGLKTNIAEYGSKGYEVSFRQEYEIESKSESDTESSDLAFLMKSGEGKPYYKVDVKDFTVEGRILNTELEDLTLDRSFVEYTDENKADFIVAFLKHVIPFYEEKE